MTRLRSTARAAALAALAMTAAPHGAHAQEILHEAAADYRSPQCWALELRFGPYLPNVDSEFTGPAADRPHRRYFGGKQRIMSQVEVDYQFFRGFGSAAIALSAGQFREKARAFAETSAGAVLDERSSDTTTLTLYPLAVSLVYRLDVTARRLNIPLVPYGKIGLGYTIWRVTDGNGVVARTQPSGRGRGGTPGWHAAAGLSLELDFLDPGAARELDTGVGVNHTYLFIEGAHYDASGFGRGKTLDVGDTTWVAGLMFEF